MLKNPKEQITKIIRGKRKLGNPVAAHGNESWGISTSTSSSSSTTSVSSVTSALVLEARASEARLLLALKKDSPSLLQSDLIFITLHQQALPGVLSCLQLIGGLFLECNATLHLC